VLVEVFLAKKSRNIEKSERIDGVSGFDIFTTLHGFLQGVTQDDRLTVPLSIVAACVWVPNTPDRWLETGF
jgi:hypothetical protein